MAFFRVFVEEGKIVWISVFVFVRTQKISKYGGLIEERRCFRSAHRIVSVDQYPCYL